jgi:predicted MFS family arabinose efflux permease
VVMCGMVLVPWIITEFGFDLAFAYAVLVMGLYGLLRVVGETAMFPWMLEAIPNSVRGKFTAVATMVAMAVRLLTVTASGYVIGHYTGLWRYQTLIVFGCFFGLVSVLIMMNVPGGAPGPQGRSKFVHFQQMRQALKDRNLLHFLVGVALLVLGTHSWWTFAPLYLKEVVGLSQAQIVLLQSGTMIGSFAFSYLWGYVADRYGSKRVLIAGIALIFVVPAGWLGMPVDSAWSLYWAASIAVLLGIGEVAWSIGHTRLLYVNVVPAAKKMEYLALFYAVIEMIRFTGPLASGLLLDYLQGGDTMPADLGTGGPYQTYFTL